MNLTDLTQELGEKLTRVDESITLATGTDARLINKGYLYMIKKILASNKRVADMYFRSSEISETTDLNGQIILPVNTIGIAKITETNGRKIEAIHLDHVNIKNGYVYAGINAERRKIIEIYESGSILPSQQIKLWVYAKPNLLLNADDIPIFEDEYHEIITDFAAYIYFSRQGMAYQAEARKWLDIANTNLMEMINEIDDFDFASCEYL